MRKWLALLDYVSRMGLKWFTFRIIYALKLKTNHFVRRDKENLKLIDKYESLRLPKWFSPLMCDISGDSKHINISNNALDGNILVFSNEYLHYNVPKDSNYNPLLKVFSNKNIHWSKIADFGDLGDIKIPWELSRFPHFFSYIKAHKITNDDKYINAFKNDIKVWFSTNEFPNGINYKCGQEITFRLFSILIASNYFFNYLDDILIQKIAKNILASGYRIEENIDYAIISSRNDHAISESIGLLLCGLMFNKQVECADSWYVLGREGLLKELATQVYKDGSYLCHSFNYQREVLDELSFLLIILKNNFSHEDVLIKTISDNLVKMVGFLNSFIQPNGYLPNYGSNDGAFLFPIVEGDYRDYRDSLNLAYSVSSGSKLFSDNVDLISLFCIDIVNVIPLDKKIIFDDGGYYILKNDNIFSFIRCHSYKHRPSSSDMFHLDIWHKGINIFCDSGSYSYNTDREFKNNFTGVVGHNTVMINNSNQMDEVLNFGYSNWTKAEKINSDSDFFLGNNYAYDKRYGVVHQRSIKLRSSSILVIDNIKKISSITNIKQIWNTMEPVEVIDKYRLRVGRCLISSNLTYKVEVAYISEHYNSYKIGSRIVFEENVVSDFKVETIMEFY